AVDHDQVHVLQRARFQALLIGQRPFVDRQLGRQVGAHGRMLALRRLRGPASRSGRGPPARGCRMAGHVIISHGLESSPDANKATALDWVSAALGGSTESPAYLRLEA